MAAGSTAQVLGKISQEHLECSICTCRFREPKALDCLHSFCLKCLQELRRHKDPQSPKLACPLCRRETKLEGKQVSDLPNNFTLSALIEEFTIQEQVLESQQSQVHVICQACDENNKAASVCMDCAHFLCQECQTAHKRLKLTKSHKIFTMAQLQSGEITYRSRIREEVPKCSKHTDQNFSIYCGTCELLLCTTCSVLDHPKPEHSLSGLPEAVDKCKIEIQKLAAQAEKKRTEISTSTEDTKKTCTKLNTTFADVKKKISTKANKEVAKKEQEIARIRRQIAEIRQEEQTLQQEVQKIYKERVKIFETAEATNNNKVTQAEEKLHQTNQLMSEAICCDLLNFKQKLLFNLQEITRKQPEKVSDNLSFMDFEEGEKTLGKLVLEAKPKLQKVVTTRPTCRGWELRTDIKTFGPQETRFMSADSITAFTNNEIAVLDRTHTKIITLTMTEGKSQIHSQELQLRGLTNPTHVAVNKFNQLIVLDSPRIKIFDRKTQSLLHQFTPGRRFSSSKPTCVSVDDDNVIAVGYESERKVSLHDQNGQCIKRLHVPMIGINLTACKQRLIYTVPGMNKLVSVDYNGGTVFLVDIPSDIRGIWCPSGLCCDSNGDIYVCVYRWPIPGEIQHFSPTGEYIGCVIDGCGYPIDITLTPTGDLVMVIISRPKVHSKSKRANKMAHAFIKMKSMGLKHCMYVLCQQRFPKITSEILCVFNRMFLYGEYNHDL